MKINSILMNNLAASRRGTNFIYNTVFRSKLREIKPTSVGLNSLFADCYNTQQPAYLWIKNTIRYFFIILFLITLSHSSLKSQNQKIVVGCDYNYPPYSFINDKGEMVGYDIDIINEIAELSNIEVEFVFANWDTTLMNLEKGNVDLIASIVYSESRESIYDFSFPLHTEYYAIFANKKTHIVDVHDLESKRPAFLKGDISNDVFLKPMGLLGDSIPVQSLPDAFKYIESGLCDYVIAPYPLGMKVISEQNFRQIQVKGPSIIPSIYCLAVKQGNIQLLARLNIAIEQLSRSGKLNVIYNKWVKFKQEDDRFKNFFTYSVYILIGLLIIILILIVFWYSLRNQVLKKTKQIKDAEVVYQGVFNTVDDALFVFDKNGSVVDANKKALDMYGIQYSQILGKEYLNIISSENKKLFQSLLDTFDADTFQFDQELTKTEGNNVTYLRVKGIRIYLENNELYLAVLRNITDEKTSFLTLQKAKKMADEANNAKSVFLSTMSHEIRTPLNAIIGYSDLLSKTKLGTTQFDYNNKIKISGEILISLANNILDLTKMEANKLIIENKPFNVRGVIERVCDIAIFKIKEKSIELIVDIDNNIPEFIIGDELRLSQILLNIINNAIKFTEKGQISIFVNFENIIESANKSVKILFSIKDTGIGIPIEKQSILFQPFEQVQKSNARKYGGTGLGLAISKQLVDLMQGDIMVESTVGVGSIFSFSVEFEIGAELNLQKTNTQVSDLKKLCELSILLVEDNEFNAEILIEQLSEYKCKITHAASGIEALEILNNKQFDVILMDIEMPEMDGFETMLQITKLNIAPIPVIALSAHSLDSEKEKALEVGMVDYLCKPVKIELLINTIMKYTNSRNIKNENKPYFYKEGLQFFNGDTEMYKRALIRFKNNYIALPDKLLNLFSTNKKALKTHTHNLKSSAKMIGAEALAKLATKYDKVLRDNPEEFSFKNVNMLIDELNKVLDFIDIKA